MNAARLMACAASVVGACTATPPSKPLQVVVDGKSVFVLRADTKEEAAPLADEACHERNAVSVFHGFMQYRAYRLRTNSAWFECISRAGQRSA